MRGRLIYNEEHMQKISMMYIDSADLLEDAYRSIESAGKNLPDYYKGEGEKLFDETARALYSHLKLLESCSRSLSKYVDTSYTAMKLIDGAAARGFARYVGLRNNR